MTSAKPQENGSGPGTGPDHHCSAESWQPLPHIAPDSVGGRVLFGLRLVLDLEVSTIYRDVKVFLSRTRNNVLEVGCGLKPYRHLVPAEVRYSAIDSKDSQERFSYKTSDVMYYEGDTFPLQSGSFDFIFHTEVLEHIYDPRKFLSECFRVLSAEGQMFFTVPFAARYHYIPHDYWRFTPASLERLLKEAGFSDVMVRPRGSDVAVAASKLNVVFFKLILAKIGNPVLRVLNMFLFGLLFAPLVALVNIAGHLAIFLRIGSPDDPLGYSVHCRKAGQ